MGSSLHGAFFLREKRITNEKRKSGYQRSMFTLSHSEKELSHFYWCSCIDSVFNCAPLDYELWSTIYFFRFFISYRPLLFRSFFPTSNNGFVQDVEGDDSVRWYTHYVAHGKYFMDERSLLVNLIIAQKYFFYSY